MKLAMFQMENAGSIQKNLEKIKIVKKTTQCLMIKMKAMMMILSICE